MIFRSSTNRLAVRLAAFFLLSRVALLAAGLIGAAELPPGKAVTGENLGIDRHAPRILEMWTRWDAQWYLLIAEHGYDASEAFSTRGVAYHSEDTAGFFPLYPLAIRALAPLLGTIGAGLLIANAALAVTVWLIVLLARDLWPEPRASHIGAAAAVALLVVPFTVFHSSVYAESLFLALSLATIRSAVRGRFIAAGGLAALAALTRPFGILLVVPLLLEWWPRRRSAPWAWLSSLPPAAAVGLFMLFCQGLFGDPLAFVHRQARWRGSISWPGEAFVRWWTEGPTLHGAHGSTLELIAAVAVVLMVPLAFKKLRPSLAVYLLVAVIVPLSSSLWSFGRLASTFFPLYLVVGCAWADGRRALPLLYAVVGATAAVIGAAYFAAGAWVG